MTAEWFNQLDISGGIVHSLTLEQGAALNLSGGSIGELTSNQAYVPHEEDVQNITLGCRSWSYDDGSNILSGVWEDYSTFDIQLYDGEYTPTIENIEFIIVPEPVSIVLYSMGGLLVRRLRGKRG